MIFNAEMVRAILDGRKTQTRRIMKVQPGTPEFGLRRIIESSKANENGMYFWSQDDACGIKARSKPFLFPYGEVGDRIWVRETFCAVPDHEEPAGCSALLYAADGNGPYGKWTPSIHMPRWASRLTLEITGVRVERLRDLSEDDAKSEGITPPSGGVLPGWEYRINFRDLWMDIYGTDNWEANPWVWVIEFKRVEGGAA
ncbi:hypothetical protein R980_22375 [Salmonella enterica subsp. enterica]|nr:hypothetical protein [Salmonella enterica subsp. enterica]ECI4645915.1 hypothetical protein [Salmonella enterica subsp. salamae]EDW2080214.1 hypothetical protein [Salmonella enterica subsp. enterica serovar Litchfield]